MWVCGNLIGVMLAMGWAIEIGIRLALGIIGEIGGGALGSGRDGC